MKITSLNTLEKFIPYPERIASSARLAGVKGNEQQRNQLAQDLNNKLVTLVSDAFEQKIKTKKKPSLDKKEFLGLIKQLLPDVNIKISSKKMGDYDGYILNSMNKSQKTVDGFIISLPRTIKKDVDDDVFIHEMRHIFDNVTQPKMNARFNTDCLIGRLKDYSIARNNTHFYFYEENLYKEKTSFKDEDEIKSLTKTIKKHFKSQKATTEEKIEMLQCWRYSLKGELNAYLDQTNYINKTENSNNSLEDYFGDYFFEGKIKLIENILKDEISSIRKANAKKLKQN